MDNKSYLIEEHHGSKDLYARGLFYYTQKEYKKAIDCIAKCDTNDIQDLDYLGKLIEIGFTSKIYQNTAELCRKYLSHKDIIAVQYVLGSCLKETGQMSSAIVHLELCFKAGFNLVNTLEKLCYCTFKINDVSKLQLYCTEYLKLTNSNKNRFITYIILNKLFISGFMISNSKILEDRQRFDQALTELLKSEYVITNIDEFTHPWTVKVGFPLSYHSLNNKDIYKKLSYVFRTICPSLNYTAKHCSSIKELRKTDDSLKKLKVGFISSYFFNHSVAKDRRGIIKLLDRNKYNVYSLFLDEQRDHISTEIQQCTISINILDIIKNKKKNNFIICFIFFYCF